MFRKCIKRFYTRWADWNSLYGTVHDFSVDHSSIKEEDIFNIHQYLMVENNMK